MISKVGKKNENIFNFNLKANRLMFRNSNLSAFSTFSI